MLKNSILILMLCLGFISCEKNIEYKGIEINNFLVMNSILNVDSVISCKITRSNTLFESTPIQNITDASVGIYTEGVLIDNLKHIAEGNYISEKGVLGQIGTNYTIKASHNKYESIEAITKLLEPVSAKIISIKEGKPINDYYYGYDDNSALKFEVEIDDVVGSDYYRLIVYAPDISYESTIDVDSSEGVSELITTISSNRNQQNIESSDPVLNNNKVVTDSDFEDIPYNTYTVFDDFLFDGEKYTLDFEIFNALQGLEEADKQKYLEGIEVDVQKISKDLYKHFVTVTASSYYGDSPFSEPVQIFSNIIGGAGILGSSSSNILPVENRSSTVK